MAWEVEFTAEFEQWWNGLEEAQQIRIDAAVGPDLPYPMSSGVQASRHPHMRELRVQIHGRPFRVLYAFDPRRTAILLLGEAQTGDDRWYELHVPKADRLYDQYLEQLGKEAEDG